MFEKIFKSSNLIKEIGFEYYNLQEDYDVSINFIKGGTKVPPHAHDQEVFNYVFKGNFLVSINDIEKIFTPGEWLNIPAGSIHSVEAKTDVVLLELWKK